MKRIAAARSVIAAALLLAGPAAVAGQDVARGRSASGGEAEHTAGGTVVGRVLSVVGRAPLEGATVTAWRGGRLVAVAGTDARGRYRLAELPTGRVLLRVVTADHAAHEVALEVGPSAPLRLDLVLGLDPPVLPPIHAEGERLALAPGARRAGEPPVAATGRPADPGLRSLETGPGVGLPGASLPGRPEPPPSDPGGALYVRGAASDLKRVYLDGAPVYTPFHLGGLMDAAPEGVLRSATLYTGGAPLAYDGGLSYVLDLRTRAGGPDERAGGRLDLMGGSLRAEGGGEHASWLASGRRSHAGAADWLAGADLPYGYSEALGRVDLRLAEGHRLAVTGFLNEELVRLGGSVVAAGGSAGGGSSTASPVGEARWGNEAASLRYRGTYGSTELHATAAASGFTTALPVANEPERLARSETGHARLAFDATTDAGGLAIAYGAALEGRRLDLRLPPGEEETGLRWRGRGGALSLYGAATVDAGDAIRLTGGLRAHGFGADERIRVGPRLSIALRASDASRLVLSGGRFHQRLGAPESVLSSDLDLWTDALRREAAEGFPGGAGGFPALAVASASHLNLRLDHRPEEGLTLGLEGYLKTFDELAAGDDLHASGADLWLDWSGDAWRAWGGYSIGWAWSDAPPDSAARGFTGRQLVGAGAEADLPSAVRLSAEVRASSGLPFRRLPLVPDAESDGPTGPAPPTGPGGVPPDDLGLAGPPAGSYLRLDLSVSRRWSLDVMGRSTTLRPYLRVLNALDRRDALFYHFDPAGRLSPRALDTMPLLPVVGVAWEVP